MVTLHHFDASLVFTLIVIFVDGTLVPFMVVAPKYHVLLPSESVTGLLPGGGVVELLGDFLPQPAIKMVAAITPMMIAFFIKRNDQLIPQPPEEGVRSESDD